MRILELSDVRCAWSRNWWREEGVKHEGATLDLDEGQWCAVVGDNGLGKSTLLHGIAGSCPHVEGAVKVNNTPLRPRDIHQRFLLGVYMVPQEPKCQGRWTLQDIEAMAFRHRPGFRLPQAVSNLRKEILGLGVVTGRRDQFFDPREARTLLSLFAPPSVLLLDEVGGLFSASRTDVYDLIKRFLRKTAVVFVEHDQSKAKRYADQVVCATLTTTATGLNKYSYDTKPAAAFDASAGGSGAGFDPAGDDLPLLDREGAVADNLALAVRAATSVNSTTVRNVLGKACAKWSYLSSTKPVDELSGGQKVILHYLMEFITRGVVEMAPPQVDHVFPNNLQTLRTWFRSRPQITSGKVAAFSALRGGFCAVTTTGFPTPELSAWGLPFGVSFGPPTQPGMATLTVVPRAVSPGIYTITVEAKNEVGVETRDVTLQIK